jgi:hypothetical protein
VLEALEELGGLPRLRDALNEYFLERGHILRCFRIARDARSVLNRIRFDYLPDVRRRSASDRARLARFQAFIQQAGGEPDVATELDDFIVANLRSPERGTRIEALWLDLDTELGALLGALGEHSADFGALQTLAACDDQFSTTELEELRALLGMYGSEPKSRLRGEITLDHCIRRQVEWRTRRDAAPRGSARAAVAARAHDRLGILMEQLETM